ncbi:MAG: hypothetical protein ACTHM1_05340 [Solirubrobacteraceae bacterium]
MRNVKVLCAAFLAVLAFGAVSAAGANASEWLESGAKMGAAGAATTSGSWTLVGKSFFGFVTTEVTCTGALLGTVGTGAKDEVTLVEDNKGHKGGNGTKLECVVSSVNPGGCKAGETAVVEPTHMPWPSTLTKGTKFPTDTFTGTGGEPGFTVSCNGHTNTCVGKVVSQELKNNANGTVSGEVSKSKSESCTEGGSSAEVNASGTTSLNNGKELSVLN